MYKKTERQLGQAKGKTKGEWVITANADISPILMQPLIKLNSARTTHL